MSFKEWFNEDEHDLYNFPIEAMEEAFNEGMSQAATKSNDKIKEVLKLAVLVAEYRGGDVTTEDGCFATTDLDTLIALEAAICEAFSTESDDVTMLEIAPKINAL